MQIELDLKLNILLDKAFRLAPSSNPMWLSLDLLNIFTRLKIRRKEDISTSLNIIFNYLKNIDHKLSLAIVPAFCFDFPRTSIFHTLETKPSLGSLPTFIFEKNYSLRSLHPFYSFYAFGKDKFKFLLETSELTDSVGDKSVFNYINKNKFNLISIGHHYTSALSSIHQTEYIMDVNYRNLISFEGTLVDPKLNYIREGKYLFYARKESICNFSGLTINGMNQFQQKGISKKFIIQDDIPIGFYSIQLGEAHQYIVENHSPDNILVDNESKSHIGESQVITPSISLELYKQLFI